MQIGLILAHRYPEEPIPPVNYEVRTDAEGNQWISYWNESALGPKPAEEQLRGWWLDAEKWNKKNQLKVAADDEYRRLLFPEGTYTEVEKDEILEKKAAKRAGAIVNLPPVQQRASDLIDSLRTKRVERFQAVNQVTQQAGETLEQAVSRVRAISW